MLIGNTRSKWNGIFQKRKLLCTEKELFKSICAVYSKRNREKTRDSNNNNNNKEIRTTFLFDLKINFHFYEKLNPFFLLIPYMRMLLS